MKITPSPNCTNGKQLVNEVEDITGQKINHVAMVQFGGLVKVVDALGGVELCYDQDVSDPYSQLNWTAGCHTADGTTALAFFSYAFTRTRKAISVVQPVNVRSSTP